MSCNVRRFASSKVMFNCISPRVGMSCNFLLLSSFDIPMRSISPRVGMSCNQAMIYYQVKEEVYQSPRGDELQPPTSSTQQPGKVSVPAWG